jgi:adenine deaminase
MTVGWDKTQIGREELMDVALGNEPADVVLRNGRLVNVHAGKLSSDEVAIKGGRIAAVGSIEYAIGPDTKEIDAAENFVVPGLVNPHIHQWHSYHNGTVFAQALLAHGTTAAADGIYGPGIVAGTKGIRFFLEEMLATPLKFIFLVPTLSYSQNRMIDFPVAPDSVTPDDLMEMLDWPESWGIEETGYELLLDRERRDPTILKVFEKALSQRKVITGHGPNLPDERALNGWMAAGVMNNHEIISIDEARRQADLGMYVLLREGSSCRDMRATVTAITEDRYDTRAYQLCPDFVTAEDVFEGQQDAVIREAVRNGLDPIRAIQMATIQPAEFFRVNHDMGMIAAGRFADMVIVEDLADFTIDRVIANGEVHVQGGELVQDISQPDYPQWMYETIKVSRTFKREDFRVKAPIEEGTVNARVVDVIDGYLVTEEMQTELRVSDGEILADPSRGINKVTLIDRLHGSEEYGVAFVRGFNLEAGAMGSSVNVFNQGIVVVAASDEDMAAAANAIVERGGAFVAVRGEEVVSEFPIPLLGLCSDLPYAEAKQRVDEVLQAWRGLGCDLQSPFANLEFITFVTIPSLRISFQGLAEMRADSYRLLPIEVS